MESDTSDVDNDVPDTGAAFTFGKSKNQQDFIPEKYYFKMDAIKQVCCGDRHTAILTQHGKLYTFGSNDWGQLGHGHNNPVPQPKKIKALRNEPVHLVACGRCHTLVYTASGKLYSCGINTGGQLGIGKTSNETSDYKFHLVAALSNAGSNRNNSLDNANASDNNNSTRSDVNRITQLECGADHSLALTSDGTVYAWGENDQGQLGLGDCEMRSKPTPVSLIREAVKEVSSGYYHSAAITVSGKLWTWGDAESGQLGLSSQRMEQKDSPECVLKLDEAAEHVSCGSTHTAVITKSGKLYSFGTGKSGQLGLGPKCMRSNLPKLVENIQRNKCTQVKCGENHTAVLNEKGQLVMFGDGRDGKLCQVGDEFANVFNPVPVLRFKKFKVLSFSLGGTHSVVVAAKRDISSSGGFDDSDDEGGLMSDEDDDMAKFDYLGGTSMLRMASTRSGGRKSATLPVPGKMGGNKLSPRDRRRVKKIEEEKERLNQTLPVHWTTKLGSLPDLSIPDLPISSSTQDISALQSNKSDENPVAKVRTIKSKPMEVDEGVIEDSIVEDDKRKALHASAPDLFLASQSDSAEVKDELADEVDKEKKEKEEDNLNEDDKNGDTASLNTTHDSSQENEENDEGKKKGGKILGLFGRKSKSTDEEGKETSEGSEKDKDKKSKKHEDVDDKEKSKDKDKKSGKNGKEKEKEKKDKKSDKDKSKDDSDVKKVSFAAELDLDLSEDSWAEDEKDKGKKGKKNKKKDDKEKDKEKDKDKDKEKEKEKEKEHKKDKKSKKDKDSEQQDDDKHDASEDKKDEKEDKKKSKFSLFGGKKSGSKESVDQETSEVMEFGASDNDTDADNDEDHSTLESPKDKKSKDKKSKDKDKEKEKEKDKEKQKEKEKEKDKKKKDKDKDKKKKNGEDDHQDEDEEDSEETESKKKNAKKDGKDKDKKDKDKKEKEKEKDKDKKGKDKDEKKDSKKSGVKSADSVTSLASSGISDDIEEIYSDLEDVSGEEEVGESDEEEQDSKKTKKNGKKEKEKEKKGKDKHKEKEKDSKKDKEKEKEKEKKDKGKDEESPDEKSNSKKTKKKVTIKDDKGSIDDDEEEEITASKKKAKDS